MLEKLKAIDDRYEAINQELMDPAVIADNGKYTDLMR